MTAFATPVVAWRGDTSDERPLVVLLHGRGSNETDIITLADHLPEGLAYAAVRAPIGEGVPTTPGRLAGLPVLVAHGDADTVIPSDLLERTWTYLHDEAGSATTGVRDPGGHGLSVAVIGQLSRWLTDLTSDRSAHLTGFFGPIAERDRPAST
jgi:phospholipase/carboxylesterase